MSLTRWNRIVLKVGSNLIAPNGNGCSSHYLLSIAQFIVKCRMQGVQVILVSSGSVAAGRKLFKQIENPSIAIKKAMAAAGQSEMMATWDRLFDFPTAQILLTHGDLRARERYKSVKQTIYSLLDNDILPVINENDTVTTDNLKVGDNDNLAAMIATAADADTLIICSDIKGLYDKNPNLHPDACLIPEVSEISDYIYSIAGGATSSVGTGGMKTKIEAAEKAVSHGINTFIVDGFSEQTFIQLLAGGNPGTLFHAHKQPMQEHQHWLTHTASAQGEIIVEKNDTTCVNNQIEELTCEEVLEVNGEFSAGDMILVKADDGNHIAKVKSNFSSCLLHYFAEQDKTQLQSESQNMAGPIVSNNNFALL